MKRTLITLIVTAILLSAPINVFGKTLPTLEEQVHHEILMLPYYQIFDRIDIAVEGGTVTLSGVVTRPVLKSSAEKVLAKISDVKKVVNNIEVLPYSPYDDRIRTAVFRAIYYSSQLNRYVLRPYGPIHIIVENGDVRLEGYVQSEADKNTAGILARGVSGVFTVTNDLAVLS